MLAGTGALDLQLFDVGLGGGAQGFVIAQAQGPTFRMNLSWTCMALKPMFQSMPSSRSSPTPRRSSETKAMPKPGAPEGSVISRGLPLKRISPPAWGVIAVGQTDLTLGRPGTDAEDLPAADLEVDLTDRFTEGIIHPQVADLHDVIHVLGAPDDVPGRILDAASHHPFGDITDVDAFHQGFPEQAKYRRAGRRSCHSCR